MTATSPYDELTPESIKASMLSDLTAKGVDVSIREGSYANTLVSVAAYQLFKMYQQFPSLLHMAFPDETSGEYIDKNAAQIGMVRAAGKKATVEIAFTGTEGTYIAAGTALYAPESGLQFLTTEEAIITDGSATAPAEAAEVGADYNLPPDSITAMYVNVAGVLSVTNTEAAVGGVDVESDIDFLPGIINAGRCPSHPEIRTTISPGRWKLPVWPMPTANPCGTGTGLSGSLLPERIGGRWMKRFGRTAMTTSRRNVPSVPRSPWSAWSRGRSR